MNQSLIFFFFLPWDCLLSHVFLCRTFISGTVTWLRSWVDLWFLISSWFLICNFTLEIVMVNIWNSNGNFMFDLRDSKYYCWTSVSNCCLVSRVGDTPVPQNHSLWKNHSMHIGENTVLWVLPFLLLYPLHHGESFWTFAYVIQGLWPFIEIILALYSLKSIFYPSTLYLIIG